MTTKAKLIANKAIQTIRSRIKFTISLAFASHSEVEQANEAAVSKPSGT